MRSWGPSRNGGITLAEILVVAAAIVLLLAVLIPIAVRVRRHDRIMVCIEHLKTLHGAQADPRAAALPFVRGSAAWTRLAELNPPLLRADDLRCPLAPEVEGRTCDYLGPVREPKPGPGDDPPIACDDLNNHGAEGRQGGNVLRMSGAVVTDPGSFWQGTVRNSCTR